MFQHKINKKNRSITKNRLLSIYKVSYQHNKILNLMKKSLYVNTIDESDFTVNLA